MGCPYWPDPTDPRAIAWLEGYRERNNELGALLTEQAQSWPIATVMAVTGSGWQRLSCRHLVRRLSVGQASNDGRSGFAVGLSPFRSSQQSCLAAYRRFDP
jgi:hypothetical protein